MSEKDIDPQETIEWLEAFRSVARFGGEDRAKYILQKLMDMAHEDGMDLASGSQYSLFKFDSSRKRE